MTDTLALAFLAQRMALTPKDAIALPTVVKVAANKMGWKQTKMIDAAMNNAPLRDYLAKICRDVTADMKVDNTLPA